MSKSKLLTKEHVISESLGTSEPFYDAPVLAYAFDITDYNCLNYYSFDMASSDTQDIYGCIQFNDGTYGWDPDTPSSSDTSVVSISPTSFSEPHYSTLTAQQGGSATVTWNSDSYLVDYSNDYYSFEAQVADTVTQPKELILSTGANGIGDCYWAGGTQITIGYTRVISWQVVGPAPNHRVFYGSEVPTVAEHVQTTSGPTISGGGVWQRVNPPYSISPNGVFTDYLSANGNPTPSTANQTFTATGASFGTTSLIENIGGQQYGTLGNYYSVSTMIINNTTAPRACQSGDPN
jgi:hypothetical protein